MIAGTPNIPVLSLTRNSIGKGRLQVADFISSYTFQGSETITNY